MSVLQLSLRSWQVSDVRVLSVINPHTAVPFLRHSDGKLKLDCWVPSKAFESDTTIEQVCGRGFTIGEEGKQFEVGNIDIDSEDLAAGGGA